MGFKHFDIIVSHYHVSFQNVIRRVLECSCVCACVCVCVESLIKKCSKVGKLRCKVEITVLTIRRAEDGGDFFTFTTGRRRVDKGKGLYSHTPPNVTLLHFITVSTF